MLDAGASDRHGSKRPATPWAFSSTLAHAAAPSSRLSGTAFCDGRVARTADFGRGACGFAAARWLARPGWPAPPAVWPDLLGLPRPL
eukprot:342864-Chlamydomonas_euryale.AAC.1